MKFLNVKEVQALLGVGSSKAYQIMKEINDELKAKGYLAISGKVQDAAFYDKLYKGGQYEYLKKSE
jgi:hypothetical protein